MARPRIIPKRIGRFKVPKRVRRFGDRALADPRVAEAAVALVGAVAASAAARGKGGAFVRDLLGRVAAARGGAAGPEHRPEDRSGDRHASGGVAAGLAAAVLGEMVAAFRAGRARAAEGAAPRRDDAGAPVEEPGEGEAKGEDGRVH